jgi:hypothetical protein
MYLLHAIRPLTVQLYLVDLKDPWVEPGFERDPIEEEVDVVIVGGGYGAQVVAVRLIEAGVDKFRIIEKAGDFGGTWCVH